MKRLLTSISTHTAAVLLGFSIAFFTAHFNQPRIAHDENDAAYSIHVPTIEETIQQPGFLRLGEIVDDIKLAQAQDNLSLIFHAGSPGETIQMDYVVDNSEHKDLRAEIQRLRDENRRLKMFKKLQTEFKKLKRENQKLRKQTNTQPGPAENDAS